MSTLRTSHRRRVIISGLVPIVAVAALVVYRPAAIARIDDSTYDLLLRSSRAGTPDSSIAIVDVDERSLSEVGQWPWRRDVVSRLIAQLRRAGAAVIALDVIFAESDRYAAGADGKTAGRPNTPDDILAATLREGGVVLGYGLTFDAAPVAPRPCALRPIGVALVRPPAEMEHEPFFRATGVVCNVPVLGQAAAASGFLNAAPDSDGILRRAPLVAVFNGRFYPSLALATVVLKTGATHIALRVANVNAATLDIDNRAVPVDGRSNLLLRYRGRKRTFPYVSAADVLSQSLANNALAGKIVFVGTTALGTREVVAT